MARDVQEEGHLEARRRGDKDEMRSMARRLELVLGELEQVQEQLGAAQLEHAQCAATEAQLLARVRQLEEEIRRRSEAAGDVNKTLASLLEVEGQGAHEADLCLDTFGGTGADTDTSHTVFQTPDALREKLFPFRPSPLPGDDDALPPPHNYSPSRLSRYSLWKTLDRVFSRHAMRWMVRAAAVIFHLWTNHSESRRRAAARAESIQRARRLGVQALAFGCWHALSFKERMLQERTWQKLHRAMLHVRNWKLSIKTFSTWALKTAEHEFVKECFVVTGSHAASSSHTPRMSYSGAPSLSPGVETRSSSVSPLAGEARSTTAGVGMVIAYKDDGM